MKICFISLKAYALFNSKLKKSFGGAEVQVALLAKELSKKNDVNCSIIVADYGQSNEEVYDKVRVFKSFKFKQGVIVRIYNFFRVFRKINADIYIQRSLNIFSPLIAIYCKLKNKKFVYMIAHDDELKREVLKINSLVYVIASRVFNLADLVVVQNKYQKNEFEKKGINVFLLRSSIEVFNGKANYKKKGVLWVGRSEEWKNPQLLLDVAKAIPDIKFTMICLKATNNAALFKRIKHQAVKINNVEFIEFVKYDRIREYFNIAKIFINTSIKEGFPNVFLQSAVAKTLIVSTGVNPDDFLSDGRGVLVGDSKEEILKTILNIKNNDSCVKRTNEVLYAYVNKRYNLKINSEIFLEELLKLK